MKPLLMRSELTGTIYVVTRYSSLEDGKFVAHKKYDVTDQYRALVASEPTASPAAAAPAARTEPDE